MLSGTLSGYVKAKKNHPGSITISIAGASIPGAYIGTSVTLKLTKSAKIHSHGKIEDGDAGKVELQLGDAVLNPSLGAPVVAVYDGS